MKNYIFITCIIIFLALSIHGQLSGIATTTRYCDGTKGACGCLVCGQQTLYTAAPSPSIFGEGSWCGSGCGKCFQLTSQNRSPPGQGTGGLGTIVVQMVNLCPTAGNELWCSVPNNFGYQYHFDLNNCAGQIDRLGWDNPIVDFIEVSCPEDIKQRYLENSECVNKNEFLMMEK